jgi:hypothetical protein
MARNSGYSKNEGYKRDRRDRSDPARRKLVETPGQVHHLSILGVAGRFV